MAEPNVGSNERVGRRILGGVLIGLVFCVTAAWGYGLLPQGTKESAQESGGTFQFTVPNRPAAPLYKGEQGAQNSEVEFNPSTRIVTVKFHVEDPNGYFLPNLRPENFAVYEDGVRQKNVNVEVEHAPVSLALLMEAGGRYHELNKVLENEVPRVGRELLDVIRHEDKIAIFTYDEKLERVADFDQGHEVLDRAFEKIKAPNFSEINFYDALLETLNRTKDVRGRKALIVISTGVDTFSKATYDQVLQAARNYATPIYTIGLGSILRLEAEVYGDAAPFARIDWTGAEKHLEMLASASGGRAYVLESTLSVAGIYDDIMENLSLRYVATYMSSNPGTSGPPRNIKIELIDPKTGSALKIHDSAGKVILANVFVQQTYKPAAKPGG